MEKRLTAGLKEVPGKVDVVFKLATAAVGRPDEVVGRALFTVVGEKTLRELVAEAKANEKSSRSWSAPPCYVDIHGASVVGFAFAELLNFRLLSWLKNIGSIRLYRPDETPAAAGWQALGASLTRPIRWELIEQQYDQMMKYATALRLGTAEVEQVLRRCTRGGPKRPACQALEGLGRAVRARS